MASEPPTRKMAKAVTNVLGALIERGLIEPSPLHAHAQLGEQIYDAIYLAMKDLEAPVDELVEALSELEQFATNVLSSRIATLDYQWKRLSKAVRKARAALQAVGRKG